MLDVAEDIPRISRAGVERSAEASEKARARLSGKAQARLIAAAKNKLRAFLEDSRKWFDDGLWSAETIRERAAGSDIRTAAEMLAAEVSAIMLGEAMTLRRESFVEGATRAAKSIKDTEPGIVRALGPALRESGQAVELKASRQRRTVSRVIIMEPDGRFWVVREQPGPHQEWPDARAEHGRNVLDMLPGGGVEDDETDQEAAVREAMEETGLLVELTHYVCDLDDVHSRRRFFLGRRIGGEPTSVDADENRPASVRLVGIDEVEFSSAYDRVAVMQAQAGHVRALR